MMQQEFFAFVSDLCKYFDEPQPDEGRRDQWFGVVKAVPKEALDWAKHQIFATCKYMPKNPSAEVLKLWERWQIENPSRIVPNTAVRGQCPHGCDHGWIWIARYYPELHEWRSVVAPCIHCRPTAPGARAAVVEGMEPGVLPIPHGKQPDMYCMELTENS